MKIKTSELNGAALDWAVAAALNAQFKESRVIKICRIEATTPARVEREKWLGSAPHYDRFSPSTDWAQGGLIIDREGIGVREGNPIYFPKGNENGDLYEPLWIAGKQHGQTPLIAAMRCYVASKLGDEVEIPDELVEQGKPL